MHDSDRVERVNTVIVGGGQSGLSAGYHLAKRQVPFVILDASERVGDQWRQRWDSLRLFTPARFSGLDGMPFPAPPYSFPTKDQMGDFLETYARRFKLPVRSGVRVDRVSRLGDRFLVVAGPSRIEADHVVVAMANHQRPRVPAFASELDPRIVQFHSSDYRNPAQLPDGDLLIAGAGNSGAELAVELVRTHRVWMAGRGTGQVPFRVEGPIGRHLVRLVLRGLFHRVLSIANPVGRRVRVKVLHGGGPLIRVKPRDLARKGVRRVPRVTGVRDGKPLVADGRVLDVTGIVWCTGFHSGFSWIDLPIFEADGEPRHVGGVVADQPGLYFVGQHFLYSLSSEMIHGVGRDAARIADLVARRTREGTSGASRVDARAS
jgi:putative flavoprotein involved in K+ transport